AFAMGENRANSNAAPAHKAEVKKAFWMSTTELSNAQVRALLPDHSSRYFDQQWKDHVTEGYEANGDEQVALRVSWNEAAKYCELMSAKTGKNVMLPTEIQWEWAARGGVDEDYWYGNNASFATKENLSDKQALKMAVRGVNPQPMTPDYSFYPYCIYIPKDENVDDGNMLAVASGSYEANPFGLYDMIGNVSEWTRSDYYTYDSKSNSGSEYKVVKGGSWRTHPKDARVAARWYYYPWQAPFNVGVRLVIEE
ncbi:MAG: SUMF1/EgtB/PvdO family nonheme iron enzyme, partial [Rikenellaceae bacterium]